MVFAPIVSIVIPVYNGSKYLKEAIDSALAQTYKNIEVIVVNDGSDDEGKTEKIAMLYGNKIRYFYKENGGVSTALNLGIRKMKGEYFSWLSHDDVYYPNKIEAQIHYLRNNKDKNVVLYSDYDFIDARSKLLYKKLIKHVEPNKFRYALINDWPINGCTSLIPKACFKEVSFFDEQLKTIQDYDLWFKMSKKFNFIHMPEVLIKSRFHVEQGTISMRDICIEEGNNFYCQCLNNFFLMKEFKQNKRKASLFFFKFAINLKKKGFNESAQRALLLSSNIAPNSWKVLIDRRYVLEIFISIHKIMFWIKSIASRFIKIR
jgi:glycosyltransferase involved in cell wall biosynthesis